MHNTIHELHNARHVTEEAVLYRLLHPLLMRSVHRLHSDHAEGLLLISTQKKHIRINLGNLELHNGSIGVRRLQVHIILGSHGRHLAERRHLCVQSLVRVESVNGLVGLRIESPIHPYHQSNVVALDRIGDCLLEAGI